MSKICPICQKEYENDLQNYCNDDGSILEQAASAITLEMPAKNKRRARQRKAASASNVISFDRSVNHGIVTNTMHVMNPRTIKLAPPAGIVASDANMRAYAKYLIDRYHKFRKSDEGLGKMRFVPIYPAIKTEFKCSWDDIPAERFNELVIFLQRKIDKTVTAQSLRNKGQRRYESYSEWLNTRKRQE